MNWKVTRATPRKNVLATVPTVLPPAERLLDPLEFALTDSVARMPHGSAINGRVFHLAGYLRRHVDGSEICYEPGRDLTPTRAAALSRCRAETPGPMDRGMNKMPIVVTVSHRPSSS